MTTTPRELDTSNQVMTNFSSSEDWEAIWREIKEVMIVWHDIYEFASQDLILIVLSITVHTTLGNHSFSKNQNLIMPFS